MADGGYHVVPAPLVANDQHICFVCMETVDEVDETWVKACNCSLESHERCLIDYAENEEQKGKRLRCPQCKVLIQFEDRFDPILAVRAVVHRLYSGVSPLILTTIVSTSSIVGSAYYGYHAASVFAGEQAVREWLGRSLVLGGDRGRLGNRAQISALVVKVWALSGIGPALVITRALPGLLSSAMIPLTFFYGLNMVAREQPLTWPPSPEWAMILMPYVRVAYTSLYANIVGPYERRLNRLLLGQLRPEDPEPPARQQNAAADPAPGNAGGRAQEANVDENPGLLANIFGLGRAVRGLFDEPVEVDVRLELGAGDEVEEAEAEEEAAAQELAQELAAEAEELQEQDRALAERLQRAADELQAEEGRGNADDNARPQAQAPQQQERQGQQQRERNGNRANNNNRRARRNRNNNRDRAGDEPRPPSLFSELINHVVTSLLLPAISWGAGEMIRRVVPKTWILTSGATGPLFFRQTKNHPESLLQYRWGRSLVGGCLFIVLKDAFYLLVKYRKVQARLNRHVRPVVPNITSAAAAAATTSP